MAGTHGDLFSEIGKLVLAAHAGQAIDLDKKSAELARRFWNLGVPEETIARAIARSLGAVGMSMAIVRDQHGKGASEPSTAAGPGAEDGPVPGAGEADEAAKSPAALFPSGVRLALLS